MINGKAIVLGISSVFLAMPQVFAQAESTAVTSVSAAEAPAVSTGAEGVSDASPDAAASPDKLTPVAGEVPAAAAANASILGMQVRQETADALIKPPDGEPAAVMQAPGVAADAPTAAPGTQEAQEPQPASSSGIEVFTNTNYRSIMFQPTEVDRIKDAMEAYKYLIRQRGQTFSAPAGSVNTPAQPAVKVINHPQFYLASIMYHTADDWSIWLNGVKYTSQQPSDGEIIVQKVDKEKADIIWRPVVFEYYKNKQPKAGSGVNVDAAEGTMAFTLYSNQTFSAFTLKIYEGMLPSVYSEEIMVQQPEPNALQKGLNAVKGTVPESMIPSLPAEKSKESALTRPDKELFAPTKLPAVPGFQPPVPQNR